MSNVEELWQQMKDLKNEIADLDSQAKQLRERYSRLRREMGAIVLRERYGLELGDVIEVTEKGWKGDKTFRVKLDKFEVDSPKSTYPTAEGYIIKKDGKQGVQRKRLYSFEDRKFHKVS